jgi:hypothetical protein
MERATASEIRDPHFRRDAVPGFRFAHPGYGSQINRPSQILPARRTDDLPIIIDQAAAKESALHPAGERDALERRVALVGFGLGGADDEAFVRIDEGNVGVVAGRDVALGRKAEALRRIESSGARPCASTIGRACCLRSARRRADIRCRRNRLSPARYSRGRPSTISARRAAGVVADDPVNLAVEHGPPQGNPCRQSSVASHPQIGAVLFALLVSSG